MASSPLPVIAVTMGDPAGIGPEVALKALAHRPLHRHCRPVLIGHRALLTRVAQRLKLRLPVGLIDTSLPAERSGRITPGRVSATAGRAAGAAIEEAIRGCLVGRYAAMVTAPINKRAIHAAGIPFPGHTEWLAARCGVAGETMMLYDPSLAVALVTCHQALASVPSSLSTQRIVATALALDAALLGLRGRRPRLAVLGFNPHAGEGGLFGSEDALAAAAVRRLRRRGVVADGPLPPDTAFTPANRARYDGFVCMYHDQALIPFKALCFERGVNVTLGLPLIRTSVDHGTAFDIAWQGVAEHQSMISAIVLAAQLARPRRLRRRAASAQKSQTAPQDHA